MVQKIVNSDKTIAATVTLDERDIANIKMYPVVPIYDIKVWIPEILLGEFSVPRKDLREILEGDFVTHQKKRSGLHMWKSKDSNLTICVDDPLYDVFSKAAPVGVIQPSDPSADGKTFYYYNYLDHTVTQYQIEDYYVRENS